MGVHFSSWSQNHFYQIHLLIIFNWFITSLFSKVLFYFLIGNKGSTQIENREDRDEKCSLKAATQKQSLLKLKLYSSKCGLRDFLHGPGVKTSPSNAEDAGFIAGS